MQLIITFIIFSFICLIITYYFNLFISQSVYTRNEISDVLPQLGIMLQKIYSKYSILTLLALYLLSGFTGVLILMIFQNWIINSALLPLILYISGPRLAVYFEQTRVTISEDYKDILELIYIKYKDFIITGFFSGYAAQLIDNWINSGIITFFWFVLNFGIITGLTVITFKNSIFE
jgi:hypothetical protein